MFSCNLRILFIRQSNEGRSFAQHVWVVLLYNTVSEYLVGVAVATSVDRAQYPSHTLALSVTFVAAVVSRFTCNRQILVFRLLLSRFVLWVFRIPFSHVPAFLTHNSTRFESSGSRRISYSSNISVPRVYSFTTNFGNRMMSRISPLVTEYEERLRRMQYVPVFSCGRRMLRDGGGRNRFFFNYLFISASPQSGVDPSVISLRPSSMGHGSSGVISLSCKF